MLLVNSTFGYRLNPAQWKFKCLVTKEVQIQTSAQCTIVFSLIMDNDEFKSESCPPEKKEEAGREEGRIKWEGRYGYLGRIENEKVLLCF